MSDTFVIALSAALLGVAYSMTAAKPYDWLDSPAQSKMEQPGNKVMIVNYPQSILAYTRAENPAKRNWSITDQRRALLLGRADSNSPEVRASAVRGITDLGMRMGSKHIGISNPYMSRK